MSREGLNMTEAHWTALLLTGFLLSLMLCFSLNARPRTRLYRWTRRVFWAAALAFFGQTAGLISCNAATVSALAILGVPGLGLALLLPKL